MLEAVPRGFPPLRCEILENGRPVAGLRLGHLFAAGEIAVGGERFAIEREGWRGAALRDRGGALLARARRTGVLGRSFEVEHQGRRWTLAAGPMRRRFTLHEAGERRAGEIAARGAFRRRAIGDLPESLPLPVRAFLLWLVLRTWRRRRAAMAMALGGAAGARVAGR